jgi:hypothetical protein
MAALIAALLVWINPLTPAYPFLFSNFGYESGISSREGKQHGPDPDGSRNRNSAAPYRRAGRETFPARGGMEPDFITSYYKSPRGKCGGRIADSLRVTNADDWAPDYSEIHYNGEF